MSEELNKSIQQGFNAAVRTKDEFWQMVDTLTKALDLLKQRPELNGRFSYSAKGSLLKLKMDGRKFGKLQVVLVGSVSKIECTIRGTSNSPGVKGAVATVAEAAYKIAKTSKPSLFRKLTLRK